MEGKSNGSGHGEGEESTLRGGAEMRIRRLFRRGGRSPAPPALGREQGGTGELETMCDWVDSPASIWERDAAKRTLDELFAHTIEYRYSEAYYNMLRFVASFTWYSPFNAMLIHIQRPGAKFVAPAHRWLYKYGRRVKQGARPLVILQPMGPVMFVFDVSDTEGGPLPPEVEKPFEVRGGKAGGRLPRTIENSKRDGVNVHTAEMGSQGAGEIRCAEPGREIEFLFESREKPEKMQIPLRYEVELDKNASEESRYATLAHELGHLYCGHLGTPNPAWWPDRRGLSEPNREFEAESVAYLVCCRAGIDSPSERYLSGYVENNKEIPAISLDCVMKAAGLIEVMGLTRLRPREKKEKP